jgi:hypothetical protein
VRSVRGLLRPRKNESGSSPRRRALDPNGAAAAFDGFLDDGQAHAAALKFVARPQRLEHLKNALVKVPGDAGTVIVHSKLDRVAEISRANGDVAGIAVVMF